MRRTAFSIIINGGGTGGLALAALLGSSAVDERLQVRIIEPRPYRDWNPVEVDLRMYALSRASQDILDQLGLWQGIASARVSPYERMHVWEGEDPCGSGSLHFDAAEIGRPNLGHIVEDVLLKESLRRKLGTLANVNLVEGLALESIEQRAQGVAVVLSGGERMHADLLVGADGTDSVVRELAGMRAVRRSYGQRAIVASVATARPHERTAWQRFLPDGPLAFLPLADGRSSIVWTLPSARAEALVAADDATFLAALQRASGGALGVLGPISRRLSFPLQMLFAPHYSAERVVLVGDAAHTVHPLAGQGMNLGLADAACLAQAIQQGVGEGREPADGAVLRRYARQRKAKNLEMIAVTDALNRLFGLASWCAPWRMAGLAATDRILPLKRLLMQQAIGMAGVRARVMETR